MTTTAEKQPRAVYDKAIAGRFAFFRKKYIAPTQALAAKSLSAPQSNISEMEAGKQSIGYKIINKLIKDYNLNAEWLATGEGEPVTKVKADATGGLMGKSIKDLQKTIREMETKLIVMEKAISIMQANQAHFIKVIERFVKEQQG